jgi:hypothetical protein
MGSRLCEGVLGVHQHWRRVETETLSPTLRGPQQSAESVGTAVDAIVPLTEQQAALLAAAVKGDTDTAKALLDEGTKVDARDQDGGTARAPWLRLAPDATLQPTSAGAR